MSGVSSREEIFNFW